MINPMSESLSYLVGGNRPWQEILIVGTEPTPFLICSITKPKAGNPDFLPTILVVKNNMVNLVNKTLRASQKIQNDLQIKAQLSPKFIFITTKFDFPEGVDSLLFMKYGEISSIFPKNTNFKRDIENNNDSLFTNNTFVSKFVHLENQLFMLMIVNKYCKRLIIPNLIEDKMVHLTSKSEEQVEMISAIWPEISLNTYIKDNQTYLTMDKGYTFENDPTFGSCKYLQLEKATGSPTVLISSYV